MKEYIYIYIYIYCRETESYCFLLRSPLNTYHIGFVNASLKLIHCCQSLLKASTTRSYLQIEQDPQNVRVIFLEHPV